MSLRLKTEDALTAYLTAATAKPSGLQVQAGHRISDLQLPACVVHASAAAPVVEGSLEPERRVTLNCTIMTPLETASTVTAHRTAFEWLNGRLSAVTALTAVTFMGGHLGEESSGGNEKVMEDSVVFTAFVTG